VKTYDTKKLVSTWLYYSLTCNSSRLAARSAWERFGAALPGHLATGNPSASAALWKQYAPKVIKQKKIPIVLRFLAITALSGRENSYSEASRSGKRLSD